MAPRPTKTPPVPPLPDWLTGASKSTPTPTPTPTPSTAKIPDWLTKPSTAATQPINDGSSLPTVPVPGQIAQAELRGAQRDLAQATRDATRYKVP